MNNKKTISIILPTFNEEQNLNLLYSRLKSVTQSLDSYKFKIIFVDDCSKDKTADILEKLNQEDNSVQYIRFSRNCGSHAAVSAGLFYCNCDAALIMAADLQDPPEIIPSILKEWECGHKIVWGVRAQRKGEKRITILLSKMYYYIMNHYSEVKQPPSGADVFLADRSVINAFRNAPEKNTSVNMLISWLGFSQKNVYYTKEKRFSGNSKWTFSKKIKLFIDSIISFSYAPLRFMGLMGAICAFFGFIYGTIVFINAINGVPIQGWSSLMIVLLLMGGFQLSMMGMLGEYLWRTYDETRQRPRYVIEKNTLLSDMTGETRKDNIDI